MPAWRDLEADLAQRLADASDGERAVFCAGVSERLMRTHAALPAHVQRPFTLRLRPLLDAVWAAGLGDTSAFDAVKRGLGAFYLSEYCHSNGADGPDDAREPAAAAVLDAARAYMHGCCDFALFTSGAALEATTGVPREDDPLTQDPEELRASELLRQLRDLDRIALHAADLRRARFGLAGATTDRLRRELQAALSRLDDLAQA
ncbi:hypothetical protein ACH40F_55455 [Streptomyces sp. NPDC020794]|uniref:hypothetical protein n=1 Tax=unclassified Streptomyces TaxID=2593676 RepID=UPI0036E93596